MFFYLYILQSEKDSNLYVGSTNNLRRRLKEHNGGKVKSTKHRIPFKLVYYEAYENERDARDREAKLKKRGSARQGLLKRIERSITFPL